MKYECDYEHDCECTNTSDGNMNWHNRNASFAATQCQAEAQPNQLLQPQPQAHLPVTLGTTWAARLVANTCKSAARFSRIRQACINCPAHLYTVRNKCEYVCMFVQQVAVVLAAVAAYTLAAH